MRNINYSLFFKINMFFSTSLFFIFLTSNNHYSFFEFILLVFATISSAVILYSLIYILLFIFTYKNKLILYISSFIFLFVNLSLVIDFFIFKIYKFHINAMVINIITSPDAMDSIQIGIMPVILLVGLLVSFVLLEFYIIKKLLLTDEDKKQYLNKKTNKLIFIPLLLIIFGEKFTYGMYALYNQNDIIAKFKVIPLYQPLSFNRFAYKHFGIKNDIDIKNTISVNNKVNYPLSQINIKENPNKINIIIIASDAVRNSIINSTVTPNIEAFKKDAIVLKNHFSGGNATRFGIFSLMYGINSTYWFNFLDASKGSVLFDVLKRLDYEIIISSSTNTSWPEFRKTAYVNIQDNIKDNFDGSPWQKDKQNASYFINRIKNYDNKKPLFSFVFFDSPHGYSFPEEYNKFNAKDKNINYLTINKDSKDVSSVFASYKNAVAYNDKLFSDIIQTLKDKNMYDNSLIIYTSDHGQEFYEYGNFGHNNAFSKAQIQSPFILKLPNNLKDSLKLNNQNTFTSHIDIVPTLLNIIGVTNATSDYSNGFDIFNKSYKRDYVFCANWNNNAIVTKDKTYVFSNLPNKMFKNEIRNTSNYKKTTDDKKINSKLILDILNENKHFLK